MSQDQPIYTSSSTARSLWQEYDIFADRVEFKTHVGTLVVPFDQIESVNVQESDVKGLFKGELNLKGFRPALKLDWANFVEHVVLDKSGGKIHRLLFTPENPAEFKAKLEQALGR